MKSMLKQAIRRIAGHDAYNTLDAEAVACLSAVRRRIAGQTYPFKINNDAVASFREFQVPDHHVFCGYYDVTPFASDGSMILALKVSSRIKFPSIGVLADIGFFNGAGEFSVIDQTESWCWQMGCRLQWLPGHEGKRIIYNRMDSGRYVSVVSGLEAGGVERIYDAAVFAVSPDGRYAFSLNFARLGRLRPGYGYCSLRDRTEGEGAPENDGLYRMDMSTGAVEMLFSLRDIAGYEKHDTMAGAEHYFNHILVNPENSRFMFFHVWMKNGVRYTRLITSDIDGRNLYPLVNDGKVSHYNWKSGAELIAFADEPEHGKGYYLYQDLTENKALIGNGILSEDGHPSFVGNVMISDTYPDRYSERHLFSFDILNNVLTELARFHEPLAFKSDRRCDLHPRISSDGGRICIDSSHAGLRRLCVLQL